MNKKIIFFFVLSCIIIFSSCNKQNKVVNYKNSVFSDNETVSETENIDYVSDFMPSKKEIKYETKYLDITQNNNAVDLRSNSNETLFCSIDFNCDGITEDLFISKNSLYDKFHIVMYHDEGKNAIADEIYVGRMDKIDIYKEFNNLGDEYYYAVFLDSCYKKFELQLLYTGNKNYPSFGMRCYGEDLDLPISCYLYNMNLTKESFDDLLADTKKFLCKYENSMEYIETINLNDYLKNDYSEEYIKNISICDGMKDISLYRLKNDIFDNSLKFTNGAYSYYSNKSDNIEVYKRLRQIWKYDTSGEPYIAETLDDYDYLICLKASDGKNVELIYLGNKDESWLCSYYLYSNTSYAATQSGIDRDIEQFNSIMKDSISFLKNEGWEYAYTLEI